MRAAEQMQLSIRPIFSAFAIALALVFGAAGGYLLGSAAGSHEAVVGTAGSASSAGPVAERNPAVGLHHPELDAFR
jgi:uncharacterized membrane protein